MAATTTGQESGGYVAGHVHRTEDLRHVRPPTSIVAEKAHGPASAAHTEPAAMSITASVTSSTNQAHKISKPQLARAPNPTALRLSRRFVVCLKIQSVIHPPHKLPIRVPANTTPCNTRSFNRNATRLLQESWKPTGKEHVTGCTRDLLTTKKPGRSCLACGAKEQECQSSIRD